MGPIDDPNVYPIASAPNASPLRDSCTTSAPYAEVAVGLNPVENP